MKATQVCSSSLPQTSSLSKSNLMTDSMRIDSHKLVFHPHRVAAWLGGENIYPVYVEISPSGACNHRCTFCAFDYIGYRPRFLDTALLKERLTEMGQIGVKSIMYGGEGEPFLHRDIADIVRHTKDAGIDVGITSNGVLLSQELAGRILDKVSWIKISLNAGTPETYANIHRTDATDFNRVITNLADTVKLQERLNSRCTLGAQLLLLPENAGEVEKLALIARNIGLRYLVIKPYSYNPLSINTEYKEVNYDHVEALRSNLSYINSPDFSVIFREQPLAKMRQKERGYQRCLALPFWSYIDAGGTVWGCFSYLGDDRFAYGNINEQTFAGIWTSTRRTKSLEMVSAELDPEQCRINCRMDEINRYLWELSHPHKHVNFI